MTTYKVFCAFSDTCWRQRKGSGEFAVFADACAEADRVAETDKHLAVDFTVAVGRDAEELYRVPYKTKELI